MRYLKILLTISFLITIGLKAQNTEIAKVNQPCFIENKGQWSKEVLYLAKVSGTNAWITNSGIVYDHYQIDMSKEQDSKKNSMLSVAQMMPEMPGEELKDAKIKGHVVKMTFGNTTKASTYGKNKQTCYYNYFLGNDKSKWASFVPLYEEVRMENVYEGIDSRLYFDEATVRYDLIVKPGADPNNIKMNFEGQDNLQIDNNGELLIQTSLGEVKHHKLYAYQESNGQKQQVECSFQKMSDGKIGFSIPNYNSQKELIIDPLIYSTFIGGGSNEVGVSIALDGSNNAYITGYTYSSDFPTTSGIYDESYNGNNDVFISKLSSNGSTLIYSTFIGGSGFDRGFSTTIDGSKNAFVTGWTVSSDFPTTSGAYDESFNGGGSDVFVSKLSSDGSTLMYSTFIGGGGDDDGWFIALDGSNNAYIIGRTFSGFPTTSGAYDESSNGGQEAFVSKLSSDGSTLIYSTYIGGSGDEYGGSIALDGSNNAYISGISRSSNFPTTSGAYDESYNGGGFDDFVSKLSSDGSTLMYSTYIGGGGDDNGGPIALDGSNNVYIKSSSRSSNYPTTSGAYDESYNGGWDFHVSKLSSDLSTLMYSTFIGGRSDEYGGPLALDGSNNVYISGYTYSSDFPTTSGAYDESYNGGQEAFVSKLSSDGSTLSYSTFIGGGSSDYGWSIALDGSNNAFITGSTGSSDFPTTSGAYDESYNGGSDVFICKLSTEDDPSPVALCKDALIELDENGTASITTDDIDDGSYDDSGIARLTLNKTTFDCSNLGDNTVTLTATDNCGNSASCEAIVTVEDNINPTIEVSLTPSLLWPPNNKMFTIEADVSFGDNCSGTNYVLTSITSDEDEGKNDDIQNDDIGTADTEFDLRAERDGNGDGRIYTLTYIITDAAGNTATVQGYVSVPHDMSEMIMDVDENLPTGYKCDIYPNPTTGDISVNLNIPEISNISLRLLDILGNNRYEIMESGVKTLNHQINMNSFESGVYLLEIKIGNEIYHKKIIKK